MCVTNSMEREKSLIAKDQVIQKLLDDLENERSKTQHHYQEVAALKLQLKQMELGIEPDNNRSSSDEEIDVPQSSEPSSGTGGVKRSGYFNGQRSVL